MTDELLTSTQVAELLGVAPASVKRWADAGLLRCVKTAGGHRRFTHEEVQRFRAQEFAGGSESFASTWLKLLLSDEDIHRVVGTLFSERARLGSWWKVCEAMGEVLDHIGHQWSSGSISIMQEHLVSERLSRALARCGESMPSRPDGPRCLLATSEGDEHTLGLALVELCFREAGYNTAWAGRKTPVGEIAAYLQQSPVEVLAISASVVSEEETLARQANRLAQVCEKEKIALLLGGRGAWPEKLPHGIRIRSFRDLHQWISRH